MCPPPAYTCGGRGAIGTGWLAATSGTFAVACATLTLSPIKGADAAATFPLPNSAEAVGKEAEGGV